VRTRVSRFLPEARLPDDVAIADRLPAALQGADLIVIVTPTSGLEETARAIAAIDAAPSLLWACKGFVRESGRLPHEVVAAALPAGICDGLGLGFNARAALITRGLAEMARLGAAMGGQAETFNGLAGMGDLVLTCTGELSRNRTVGMRLAKGAALDTVLAELGHVAEGVDSARAARDHARGRGIEMPITEAVYAV